MLISSLSISKRENTSSPGARKYATSIIWNPASSGYGFRTKRIERFQHGLSKPKSSSIFSFHMKNTMPTTISRSQEKVDEISDYVTFAIRADLTEENVIKGLGVSNVDVAIVTIGENFEASIIVTAVCKEIGIHYIIAKASDKLQGNILTKVGADEIVYPESETGIRMAKNLAHGEKFMDIAEISDTFSIIEAKVPESWVGKNLMELSLRKKYKFNIIAIKEEGKYKINPDVNIPFNHGMHLVVLGETEKMAKVFK